jgi:hypothetical protein
MLKMAPSSMQTLLYAILEIGEDIWQYDMGNGSNLPLYRVFGGVNCWPLIAVYMALQ